MPRPRQNAIFELGGQWIAKEPGRNGYYRFWNDAGNGRTRRASLGTANFEDAKSRLAEIVVRGEPATSETHLATVLEKYFLERSDHLASAKPARHSGRLLLECWGPNLKASAINDSKLKTFIDTSLEQQHSYGYIARNLSVLAAALSHAKLPNDIPMKEGAILDKWADLKQKSKRKRFEPTDEELARLLRQELPRDFRRWILLSMGTLGRPSALLELTPVERDRKNGLIALNPEGRRQNKKFRPTVLEPKTLAALLNEWEGADTQAMRPHERYCLYTSKDSVDSAISRACAADKANLPMLSSYSFRHRGTTVLRNAKVPKEQIDFQLGSGPIKYLAAVRLN
jgi:integrase